jgi:hypothetical protein
LATNGEMIAGTGDGSLLEILESGEVVLESKVLANFGRADPFAKWGSPIRLVTWATPVQLEQRTFSSFEAIIYHRFTSIMPPRRKGRLLAQDHRRVRIN